MPLVDSSVWIAAQNTKNKEYKILKNLLEDNEQAIYTAKIIQVEVSQGAKTPEQMAKLWEGFLGLEFLEITNHHWLMSAQNFFKCRKKGISLSTIDCMIATIAQSYGVPLWSNDKIFAAISPILGFEQYR